MRLPDTVSVARRWILAGGAAAFLLLFLLVLDQLRVRPPEVGEVPGPAPLTAMPSRVVPDTYDASPGASGTPSPTRDPATGVPEGVRIPALGIDSGVEPVSLGTGGLLVPPADPSRVGWWNGGAQPGSLRGTVLLVGHSVRLGDGVFDDLAELEDGDPIRVATARGEVSYRVQEVMALSKADLAAVSGRLFSQTGTGRLVLVTCADWAAGDYRGNTVVVATR